MSSQVFRKVATQNTDITLLNAWENGETGFPFVDACMRYLRKTGWINFRMRAMLMSFASYHLWLDWRKSGKILANFFTDYDPGIHWPQVQMQSGTTGINAIRIYNPIKQGIDQDPQGFLSENGFQSFVTLQMLNYIKLELANQIEPWILLS